MGVIVDWDTPDKWAVLFTFSNPWTWTEFYKVRDRGDELAESVDHQVGAIILLPSALKLPPGALTQGRYIAKTRHPKFCITIIVSDNVLVRTMFPLFSRVNQEFADAYRQVSSLEEARLIVREAINRSQMVDQVGSHADSRR